MKKVQIICCIALFCCALFAPHTAEAQRGRAISRLSRWAIRESFQESSRYTAEVCLHNDYRYAYYVDVTLDGYNWYRYLVQPGKHLIFNAGAIGVYFNYRYYTLSSGGHHYLSNL